MTRAEAIEAAARTVLASLAWEEGRSGITYNGSDTLAAALAMPPDPEPGEWDAVRRAADEGLRRADAPDWEAIARQLAAALTRGAERFDVVAEWCCREIVASRAALSLMPTEAQP